MSDEERAAKQSELNLLMDEVERAQTRLLSLEREKVCFTCCFFYCKWSFLYLFASNFIEYHGRDYYKLSYSQHMKRLIRKGEVQEPTIYSYVKYLGFYFPFALSVAFPFHALLTISSVSFPIFKIEIFSCDLHVSCRFWIMFFSL